MLIFQTEFTFTVKPASIEFIYPNRRTNEVIKRDVTPQFDFEARTEKIPEKTQLEVTLPKNVGKFARVFDTSKLHFGKSLKLKIKSTEWQDGITGKNYNIFISGNGNCSFFGGVISLNVKKSPELV